MKNGNEKLAIVLLNMGGPQDLKQVKTFLFNLFSDKAIINLPFFIRLPLGKLIMLARLKKSKAIYDKIGGKSPILKETIEQKKQLINKLKNIKKNVTVFIAMRYTHPRAITIAKEIKNFNPDKIFLLPLYPHFSNTTTGSSFSEFCSLKNKIMPNIKLIKRCCYPIQKNFIDAHVNLIKENLDKITNKKNVCIFFSAHSLPIKNILEGDPYQWQIEQTVSAIITKLNTYNIDYKITYQSKVGPMKWLSPSTMEELINVADKKQSVIIVPISFVSENSETLVELDLEYKQLADSLSIEYARVPTLSISDKFIESLLQMVLEFIDYSGNNECINKRICPKEFLKCPNKLATNFL